VAKRTLEPVLWMLFSAGGVAAALLVPVLLVIFGLAVPLGLVSAPDHGHLLAVIGHPVSRLVLFGLCWLSLFHWAHRFRYTLYDGLQMKQVHELINTFCYGCAILGTAAAAYLLWQVP